MHLKHLKHGCFGHQYFRRWSSIVQRCYNENSKHYHNYGGRGILVEPDWSPFNPRGAENFIRWMDEKVFEFWKTHPKDMHRKIEIGRLDTNKNYGPNNCEIRFLGETTRLRQSSVLTLEKVVELRRLKKRLDLSVTELARRYQQSEANISRALRGLTWACANAIEAPIKKGDDGSVQLPIICSSV